MKAPCSRDKLECLWGRLEVSLSRKCFTGCCEPTLIRFGTSSRLGHRVRSILALRHWTTSRDLPLAKHFSFGVCGKDGLRGFPTLGRYKAMARHKPSGSTAFLLGPVPKT